MMLATQDMYDELSAFTKGHADRSEIGIDNLTDEYLTALVSGVGGDADQISRVQKGNYEFYEVYADQSRDNVSIKIRVDITVIHGFLHVFTDMLLQDGVSSAMDQLLSSVTTAGSTEAPAGASLAERWRSFGTPQADTPEKGEYPPEWAELRTHLLSLYSAGAEGKNPLGDYFYYLWNENEGDDALLVIVSADREDYDGWEGTTEVVGDHVVLATDEYEVPFCLGDVDDNGIFAMTFLNDGDVAAMHYMDFVTVVDDIVSARIEFGD